METSTPVLSLVLAERVSMVVIMAMGLQVALDPVLALHLEPSLVESSFFDLEAGVLVSHGPAQRFSLQFPCRGSKSCPSALYLERHWLAQWCPSHTWDTKWVELPGACED